MIKISFIGDVFPANIPYHIGFGIASQFKKNGKRFEILKDFFKESDLVFGNLESPLLDDSFDPDKKAFAGSQTFAKLLHDCKINLVTVANNHILEHGVEGFNSTLKHLKANNVQYVGSLVEEQSNIVEITIDDIKICFASFNAIHDISIPYTYAPFTESAVLDAIHKMDSFKPDYKVIGIHWGNEYINIPSISQISLARKFIDSGANIIVGHHPHVIQPVEEYNNGLIFYSLGNFLFDMNYAKNIRLGMIAHVSLSKTKQITYELVPTYIGKDYLTHPFRNANSFTSKINKYSKLKTKLLNKSPQKYEYYYSKKVKRLHLRQRLLMKKDLICSIMKLSPEFRRLFFKKIVNKF